MHNPESILENKTHKLLWDLEMQTEFLISARKVDLFRLQKNCLIVDFAVQADDKPKLKKGEKRGRYLDHQLTLV